jgi:prenylcysteine oxidase/farnesylcysteine lyase
MPNPLGPFFASRSRQISSIAVLLIVLLALYTSTDTRQKHASRVTNSAIVENYTYPASAHPLAQAQTRPKRIAIVGAGASGSSAAFFMRRAGRTMEQRTRREAGELIGEVVVFERENYVGGSE